MKHHGSRRRPGMRRSLFTLHLYGVMTRATTMDAMSLPDADAVVARAQRGDPVALEALYRAYSSPVYNLARRICRTTEDAEDVLQETFYEVCRSIRNYRALMQSVEFGSACGACGNMFMRSEQGRIAAIAIAHCEEQLDGKVIGAHARASSPSQSRRRWWARASWDLENETVLPI